MITKTLLITIITTLLILASKGQENTIFPVFSDTCLAWGGDHINYDLLEEVLKDSTQHESIIQELLTYQKDTSICQLSDYRTEEVTGISREKLSSPMPPSKRVTRRFASLCMINSIFFRDMKFSRGYYLKINQENSIIRTTEYECKGTSSTEVKCNCCEITFDSTKYFLDVFIFTDCQMTNSKHIELVYEAYNEWFKKIKKCGIHKAKKRNISPLDYLPEGYSWFRFKPKAEYHLYELEGNMFEINDLRDLKRRMKKTERTKRK